MSRKLFTDGYFIALVILLFGILIFGGRSTAIIDSPANSRAVAVNDSLPYYKAKLLLDSIEKQEVFNRTKLRAQGSGMNILSIGFSHIREYDDAASFYSGSSSQQHDKYFLSLPGYQFRTAAGFSIENGKYMLAYPVWDNKNGGERQGHIEQKEIGIRYAGNSALNPFQGSVLIPVSGSKFLILKILVYILWIIILLYAIYSLLILPLRILYSISKGDSFNRSNIRDLFILGCSLIGFAVIPAVLSFLFEWIFHNKIPAEIYLPFPEALLDNKGWLIAGLITLLLAKAFKKGYQLQLDQDSII